MNGVFGAWDEPFTDDLPTIAAPVGAPCFHCREGIAEGDNGAGLNFGVVHRECHLRAVAGGIGHHVNHVRYCHSELGPDAGLSKRASSLLVWAHVVERRSVSEADLERAREAA